MTHSLFAYTKLLLATITLLSFTRPTLLGQDTGEIDGRERTVADRYLQVLLRRPRPGVALDRVYGYHVQNDSLDSLQEQLTKDPQAADAGQRQMVWGLIQLQRGRSAEAATILAEAESKVDQDSACSFYLGRAYLAVGQTENAAAAMERAVEKGPARTEALPMFTELGRIYSRAGESEKSLSVWTRLEKLFPGDTRVGGKIARTLAEEGNFEEAKKRYEILSSTSRKPDDKIAFAVQAAEMQRRMGRSDEATKILEQILSRLRPGSWLYTDVRNRIESGFLKSGDYDALAEYYKTQLTERADDLALQTRLSRIMISAGRLTEAKTLLEKVIERAPDDTEARLTLIDVLVNQNDVAGAAEQFEELATRDSDNPDHLIRWGQVLLDDTERPLDERRDAATKVWSRLVQARGDDAVTLSQIADRMRGIDRSDEAIKLYRKAIEIDPRSPQYREYLGEYLHSLDRKDEAIEIWKTIAADDRRGRDSLVRLAEVFGTFKLPDLALNAWKEASEFDLTFAQEIRYAAKLADVKQYETAITRLDAAEAIAETPDEQEQLLKERIALYQSSGTLEEQIRQVASQPESVDSLRKLALMYGASGDLASAERSTQKAMVIAPDNPDVLLIAADLAERQNRFGDAAALFEKLSKADNRFRTNYLQRVANLQIRLGKTDDAIATCEAIIDANPASPESYQFYARTAFGVNREEEAVAALRRAMTVAPRDNAPRRMLASHYADRFRTDQAIELYWQAFTYEPKTDDKINVIRALAPLYDRKADLDTLIGRIEEINRADGNGRTTNLMVAAAYESVQDYGAARDAIDQLLAGQPRDVTLLENMVRLSDASDEVEMAAEYQKRITELADTPENRFKLVQYQLDAGTIDVAQALSQRLSFLSDPARLGSMVRSAARRGDLSTARAICQEAIRADDSLWGIKLTLAQLLLMDRDSEQAKVNREQAIKLAQEIRAMDVAMDTSAPTRRKQTARRPAANPLPPGYQANPLYWTQSSYQLASLLRIGRYANSSSRSTTTLEPISFGHARVIAASLILMNEAIDKTGEQAAEAVQAKLDSEFALPDLENVTEPIQLWERQSLMYVVSLVSTNSYVNPFSPVPPNLSGQAKAKAEQARRQQMKLTWRLAEIDPKYGISPLFSVLSQRMMAQALPAAQRPDMTPLPDKELELLAKISERAKASGIPPQAIIGGPPGAVEMMLQAILGFEFQLAGQAEKATHLGPKDPGDDASYEEVTGAIQFYLRLNKPELADHLVKRLLPAARNSKPSVSVQGISPTVQMMISGNDAAKEFNRRHQKDLVDAAIARWSKSTLNSATRSAALGDGYVSTYSQVGGGFRSVRVRGPLSTRLLDSSLAQQVLAFADQSVASNSNSQAAQLELPLALIKHLEEPLPGAPADELKTRAVVAAYAHWWAKRTQQCYEMLVKICDQYPSDVDLQIERARLASELKQPRLALEALDSFNPLDSRMLVRKEMAAMNLAAEIGDTTRAKVAAERLFGMRLDVNIQLALADQLKRLGLSDQAAAMLQRTRTSRARNESTEIQIAQAFLSAGDKQAAAEVAYSLFRRLSSGRSRSSNNSSYQRQVVSILKSAGRLDPLIERARRRVESSPKAIRPKQELAELYTAAGRADEANKVWETLSKDVPVTAQQMIARADALVKAKKNKEAVELYFAAFKKDPSRFSNDYYKMSNAARSAGEATTDKMFERMLDFPIDKIPTYRMSELARMGSRSKLSEAKRKFIGHLLKSPATQSQIDSIMRSLPTDQRGKIPEYREALLRAVCKSNAFAVDSAIWQVRSRGSGGKAYGPLEDTLKLLQTDADAETRFREAAGKAMEDDSQKSNAEFLLALVDMRDKEKRSGCLVSMREVIQREDGDDLKTALVSSGLLWQAGQVLEGIEGVPTEFLIDLYEEAKRTSTSSSSSPQYTLDSRLIDTYTKAGQIDQARSLLLTLSDGVDFSSQNQYNPGYGDYQQLQTYQWVAEKLIAAEAPIDALIVYRSSLSDPASFERAKRWGGSRNTKAAFEKGADAAAQAITPEVAAAHLIRVVQLWENDIESNPVELMESSPQSITSSDAPSSIALAVRVAVTKEKTRESVIKFAARLGKLADSTADSWQLPALQLMTACYLGAEGTEQFEQTLFERLPEKSEFGGADNKVTDNLRYQSLIDLYPVARAASQSQRETDREIGKRLVSYIGSVAESANDSSIALALASISGDASQSISKILDVISASAKPNAPLAESTVRKCLQVATDAAKAGEIEMSTRALALALRNGPPLRKMPTGGDAFSITPSRSRSTISSSTQPTEMDKLVGQVSGVTAALSEAAGVSLQFQKSSFTKVETAEVDQKAFGQIADAYLAIIAPADRPGPIFPYAKAIASKTSDRIRSDEEIVVASASMALAIAAAKSHRTDVTELLQARLESAFDKTDLSVALVQVALASRQADQVNDALSHFTAAIDGRLPKGGTQLGGTGRISVISSQVRNDSFKKSEVVNLVLHAIWPIIDSNYLVELRTEGNELLPEIATKVVSLMSRTDSLINSDSYTSSRHREIRRRLGEKRIELARASGDTKVVDEYLQSELDSLRTRSYGSGSDIEKSKRQALERLTIKLIDEGLINRMDLVFRHALVSQPKAKRNYSNRFEPHLCLMISQLPVQERIELLEKMTFGRSGKEPLGYFEGLVSYEIPPPIVRRQHPMLDAVMALQTSTDDYPIVNSLMMLIDSAVQSGRADSLRDKLQAQKQSAGDEADIALALLQMAVAKTDPKAREVVLDAIQPTLEAVGLRLKKALPKKNDNAIEFPALETHLVVRAYRIGLAKSVADPLIRDLKVYAIRGQRNFMVSAVARATSKMGLGRAADAKPDSPLAHFDIVPIVARYRGDNVRLMPMFSVDGEGWISGTSGYEQNHLMFKYPLAGTFTFSAEIQDGAWGEADLAYGGVIYQANGWEQTAKVLGMGGRGQVAFKVPSIQKGKANTESVSVSADQVTAGCNGQDYVADTVTGSYPFVSVHHHKYRTTHFRDIRCTGNPKIPAEVNLIDPTMRGWGVLTRGKSIPKMLLPIGPRQNQKQILQFREKMTKDLAKGPLVGGWSVREQQLHYKSQPTSSRTYDPASHIEYLRPIQDGESITIEFFWLEGKTEFSPTIGRTILRLGAEGMKPDWIIANSDLASVGYVPASQLDPPYRAVAPENVPINESWNTLIMDRDGDVVSLTLNGKPLVNIPVQGHERPGIYRDLKRDLQVRAIQLTGDWPDKFPQQLMAQ